MSGQEFLLKQRTEILHSLCSSGSSETLEKILDILLSHGELTWEDYQNVQVPGRSLYTNARQLLDLVHMKGVDACGCFLTALQEVKPEVLGACPLLTGCSPEDKGETNCTSAQNLLTQRPSLVHKLQGCIDGALQALLKSSYFTVSDCNEVRLPPYTPTQQARCLLNLVRSKGESAASFIQWFIQQKQESGSSTYPYSTSLSKEFLKYKKKLSSSVSAQSCFLSTYGGTGHMSLDDIYIEGQLEFSEDCGDAHRHLSLETIVDKVGMMNEEADTVLVSGEAGSGKSTLLQRMHSLWARGVGLQDFVLLFPFSCRRLNSEEREISVQELLFKHCCWPDREQEEIFQFILDHPHLILFTFDGLDELKQSFSDEHRVCCPTQCAPVDILLFNLIMGNLMKGVRKVVTSRSEAVSPVLKKHLGKEVLLKGFSLDGIDCFVRKNHSDPILAAKVLTSLQANTALLGLCHSPVLCWIVSRCHEELLGCGEGSPKTITDVFLMILLHFFQHQRTSKSSKQEGWLEEYFGTILHLGQLAINGIFASSYVFSVMDLEECGVTEFDISVGFLLQSKNMSFPNRNRYEFLHLTIQCFFAALYVVLSNKFYCSALVKLFDPQDREASREWGGVCFRMCIPSTNQQNVEDATRAKTPNRQITAVFVSGLLSKRHQGIWLHSCPSALIRKKHQQVTQCISRGMQNHFKSIPQPVQGEKKSMHAMPDFVWLIKCIYEMQEDRIAKDAMSKLEVDHFKLTYCNIGPVECTALAYVLQHLRNPVGLQLDNNSVGDVGVEQLLPCMHVCRSLYLRNNNITDEGIRKLIVHGIHCKNFQKIALFNNRLTDVCGQYFCHLLKTRQDFLSLKLGNNNITAEGALWLAEGLKCNHSLQFLGYLLTFRYLFFYVLLQCVH